MRKIISKVISVVATISLIVPASFAPMTALAASSGPNFADDVEDVGSDWDDQADSRLSDNSCADATVTSKVFELDDFDFNLPNDATITGIKVEVEYAAANSLRTASVQLVDDTSTTVGTAKTLVSAAGSDNCNGATFVPLGGDGDMWGTSLTVADIEDSDITNSDFGVRITSTGNSGQRRIDSVRITIFYDEAPTTGTLIVEKVVINNNGGTATPDDFYFQVNGGEPIPMEADGSRTISDIPAGTYDITEVADPGYAASYEDCEDVVITDGGTATCTITNNDIQPTITVNKIVINDDGGTATTSDFILRVDGDAVNSGQTYNTVAGTRNISEDAYAGYTGTISGDCDADGDITLLPGDEGVCTITNDDNEPVPVCPEGTTGIYPICIPIAPTDASLTIIKHVTSGEGNFDFNVTTEVGAELVGSANITASEGTDGESAAISLLPGEYDVTELFEADWTLTDVTCDYSDGGAGYSIEGGEEIEVEAGDVVVCTFTNSPVVVIGETECSDNIDNDGDEDGDSYPTDPQCDSLEDDNEGPDMCPDVDGDQTDTSLCSGGGGDPIPENTAELCSDGLDNDLDDAVDLDDESCDDLKPVVNFTKTIVADNVNGVEWAHVAGDFLMHLTQGAYTVAVSSGIPVELDEQGTFDVTETGPAGYGAVYGGACADGTLETVAGGEYFCTIENNDLPQCSNGIDDDDDDRVDDSDGACSGAADDDEGNDIFPGGGGGQPSGSVLGASTEDEDDGNDAGEQVAGAAIAVCELWLDGYIKDGTDPATQHLISKLQTFLNEWESAALKETGIYDAATIAAVKAFQKKYAAKILTPWGISEPTGWTYITTTNLINTLIDSDCANGQVLPELIPFR